MPALPKFTPSLIRFPKLSDRNPSYEVFLKGLISIVENKKNVAGLQKSAVDRQYAASLRTAFPHHDNSMIASLEDEAANANGRKTWAEVMSRARPKQNIPVLTDLPQLNLPILGRHFSKGPASPRQQFAAEDYREFAETVCRQNPDVAFDKEKMDEAFRLAASRVSRNSLGRATRSFDQMTDRCLGRESTTYWKGGSPG